MFHYVRTTALAVLLSGFALFGVLIVFPYVFYDMAMLELELESHVLDYKLEANELWSELMKLSAGPKHRRQIHDPKCLDGQLPLINESGKIQRCPFGDCPKGYLCSIAEIPYFRVCCPRSEKKTSANDVQNSFVQSSPIEFQKSPTCNCVKPPAGCPAGEPGPPGAAGVDGIPGDAGQVGNPGIGAAGGPEFQSELSCLPCPQGPRGPAGSPGSQGPAGQPGNKGLPGPAPFSSQLKGPPGPRGDGGLPGRAGNPGAVGSPGNNGRRGGGQTSAGRPGPKGIPGPPGLGGQPGSGNFLAGPPGLPGPPGPSGNAGQSGRRGTQGPVGPLGSPGNDAQYCPCPARTDGSVPGGIFGRRFLQPVGVGPQVGFRFRPGSG